MTEEKPIERQSLIIPMLRSDIIGTLLLGGAVGLAIWSLGVLLNRFVFEAYLCGDVVSSQCGDAKNYSVVLASIIAAVAALGGLIRLRVYRPLMVVVASMLSLWGIVQLTWSLSWFLGIAASVILYALAFGLFGWIARIREFWTTLIVVIVIVVFIRVALAL